jgi:chemotaxis protein CheD
MNERRVGIGEVKVDRGSVTLCAYGVGSCIVIMLYDRDRKIGGLAHCLLPHGDDTSLKYPRGALKVLLQQMNGLGAQQDKIVAKIVGGSMMFENFEKHAIGERNVRRAREELDLLSIPTIAEDVLGNWGRSVFFNLENGEVKVRSFKHGEKLL